MARTKEFEAPVALGKALEAFLDKGYAATSIQDLVDATGVNRQSLYNEFGDKRRLYIKALADYCQTHRQKAAAILTLDKPARMVLAKYKAGLKEMFQSPACSKGCLVISSIMGSSNADPEVKKVIAKLFKDKQQMMEKVIARGQKAGEIAKKHPAKAVASGLQATITGIVVMARSGAAPKDLLPIIDVAFEGLV